MTAHLLPDGTVAIDGTIHIALRDAAETMCGLPVAGTTTPELPILMPCDKCLKAQFELLNRDVRREISRRR
jgi:hypothetical protein